MRLALDIGLTGLPLGIQGVELQVQIVLGGYAGIDGAADGLGHRAYVAVFGGRLTIFPGPSLRPKSRQPPW
jgi:hypothetical protein